MGAVATTVGAAHLARGDGPDRASGPDTRSDIRSDTRPDAGGGDGPIALAHATVIDATGAPPLRDATVLLQHRRIVRVGRTGSFALPAATRTIDLTGRYVIPGLIESHTHSGSGPEGVVPPLYALTGVTTVREMWGEDIHRRWRDRITSGDLLGPRWHIGSAIVDGRPSIWSAADSGSLIEVGDEREARQAVRRVKAEGADFLKVYSRLGPEAYRALADEARRQSVPFAGHCPDLVRMADVSDAGQLTVEHLHALLLSTSRREKEIRRGLADVEIDASDPNSLTRYNSWFAQVHPLEWRAVRTYDPGKAGALFTRLAANGTALVPTLAIHRVLERPEDSPERAEEYRYLPPWQVASWPEIIAELTNGRTAEEVRQIRGIYAHRRRLVAELARHGVPLLAGTDTGTAFMVPGFALHEELELLVDAGLTPLQALQSATREPARRLRLTTDSGAEVGTIEPGKAADLVVLGGDPLADIRRTRDVHGLVVDGRWISAGERRRLLAEVRRAAADSEPPEPGAVRAASCAGCGAHPPGWPTAVA